MSYVVEVTRDVASYSDHRAGVNHLITTTHDFDNSVLAARFAQREANLTGRPARYFADGAWTTVEPSR